MFSLYAGLTLGISTHALTEGDHDPFPMLPIPSISTHALTEGDVGMNTAPGCRMISTHALTEGDERDSALFHARRRMISTHALTEGDLYVIVDVFNLIISTHALTEGDRRSNSSCSSFVISTHALTEGDPSTRAMQHAKWKFQLTPSRRATSSNRLSSRER